MCIGQGSPQFFFKDDNDGISRKNVGNSFHSTHPLNEKHVLNKSDLAHGTMALADP